MGRGGGPAGRLPRSRLDLVVVSGFGRARSSSRVSRSKNISVAGLDADPDPAAGEDLRGQHDVPAQGHGAAAGDDPLHLDRVAAARSAAAASGPALTAPSATSRARSVTVRCERTVLIRAPADQQVDQVAVGPEPHRHARPGGARARTACPATLQVPDWRHHPVELDRRHPATTVCTGATSASRR